MGRNKRLNSSQVHMNICYQLVHNDAAEFIIAGLEDLDGINNALFKKYWGNNPTPEIIIVLQAACDQPVTIHQNVGCVELNELLNIISNLQQNQFYKNVTFILPLAESNKRAHWTLVTIQDNEALFYDPKAKYCTFNTANLFKLKAPTFNYDLSPIKNAFNCFGFNLKINYTELQPASNTEDCGRVIAHIVGELLNTNPQQRPTFTNFRRFNSNQMHDGTNSLKNFHNAIYKAILESSPGLISEDDASTQIDSDSVLSFAYDQPVTLFRDEKIDFLTEYDSDDSKVSQDEVEEGILVSLRK